MDPTKADKPGEGRKLL